MAKLVVPLGLIVNPKNGALAYSGTYDAFAAVGWKEILILALAGNQIGGGYMNSEDYNSSFLLTGYPRAHTNPGISDAKYEGAGYGTVLYTALCHAVEMQRIGRVDLPQVVLNRPEAGVSSLDFGSRSEEANKWWHNAIEIYGVAGEARKNIKIKVDYLPGWEKLPSRVRRDEALSAALQDVDAFELASHVIDEDELKIEFDDKARVARVELIDIPVDIYRYKEARRFVAASIIPSSPELTTKKFSTLAQVPAQWIVANPEVLLAVNVAQLRSLKSYGEELFIALVHALETAGASRADANEFIQRYELGLDATQASGAAVGATDGNREQLTQSLLRRRQKLGWTRF